MAVVSALSCEIAGYYVGRCAQTAHSIGGSTAVAGPTCNLRDIDLGIAVGSAAKTASLNNVDRRCQTSVAVAARDTGLIKADVGVALSHSITHKAEGFDRTMPEVDFSLVPADEPPAPGLHPHAAAGGERTDGRHRQHPQG